MEVNDERFLGSLLEFECGGEGHPIVGIDEVVWLVLLKDLLGELVNLFGKLVIEWGGLIGVGC